jgi:hypothetical protein
MTNWHFDMDSIHVTLDSGQFQIRLKVETNVSISRKAREIFVPSHAALSILKSDLISEDVTGNTKQELSYLSLYTL